MKEEDLRRIEEKVRKEQEYLVRMAGNLILYHPPGQFPNTSF